MRITCVTHPLLHYNVHNTHLALFAFSQKKTSPAVKNKEIYTFLIAEAIILADWCKFSDKDGLDFTFIWVHDRGIDAAGSGWINMSDESEMNWH